MPGLELTDEEQEWLSSHPVIKVAFDPTFAPIEFADTTGQYRGIAADYLKLLEQYLDVRFEVVTPASWLEALELAQTRQVDLLPATAPTMQRSEYLIFTDPHIKIPAVVITAHKDIFNWELDMLKQMKIAVVADYSWDDWISEEFPEITLIRVPDIVTGLGLIILGTLLWNRSLRHQVALRTQALEQAQLKLIQAAKLESVGRLATIDKVLAT